MEPHRITGLVLVLAGIADAGLAMWLPSRLRDERQQAIVRLSLLASGSVIVLLGCAFFAGLVGK